MENISYIHFEHVCAVFFKHLLSSSLEVSKSTVRVLNTYFLPVSQLPLFLVV